jgi:hypothetical protein
MSGISNYWNTEVRPSLEKAAEEQRDPLTSIGERIVESAKQVQEAVKEILGQSTPKEQEIALYVKS